MTFHFPTHVTIALACFFATAAGARAADRNDASTKRGAALQLTAHSSDSWKLDPSNSAADAPTFLADFPGLSLQDDSATQPAREKEAEPAPAEHDNTSLAKQSQNPVADLISLPFQNNMLFGIDPGNDFANVLNIQPVIPVNLNDKWNLINRLILPVIYAPELQPGQGSDFGLGDLQYTAFLSPADSGKITWGVGPALRFPTATDSRLGSEKWSAGPSVVVLTMPGKWVIGGLAQQLWSYAGDSSRSYVSELLIQPFVNYNLEQGWYLTTSPIFTANWNAPKYSDAWTIPAGGGFGRVFKIGKQPVNFQVQAFYNIDKPSGGPDWSLRLQFALLFPKAKKKG